MEGVRRLVRIDALFRFFISMIFLFFASLGRALHAEVYLGLSYFLIVPYLIGI